MYGSNTFEGLGRAKKRSGKKAARGASCRAGIVRFKTKRGKVVSFRGKTGPGCGPRKAPKWSHLKKYQPLLAKASRACKGKSAKAFRKCVAARM